MKKINHSKNSLYTFLSWLVPLGLTFFATPFIVRKLGNVEYGLYALMLGFIAYGFTFNIGRAVTKYVVEYNARDEIENVTKMISATFFIGLAIGTFGALILYFGADFFVRHILLIEDSASSLEAIRGLHLVAISIWFLIIGQVFIAVVQATHRFDVYSLIASLTNILFILGNVLLVWFGFGFLYLLFWNVITNAVNALGFFYYARKLQPGTSITFGFDKKMLKLSLMYGLSVVGSQLFGNILFIYERIVITRIEGTEKLTNYVVPITIAIYLHSFIGSLTLNLMAYSSELFANKQTGELEHIYKRASKIIVALVFFMVVTLSVGGKYFLTNWIGAEFAEASYHTFIIQLCTFGMLAILIVAWQFIEGYGLPVYNTISVVGWVIISLPLMPLLTSQYGIFGTSLARFIGEITMPIAFCFIERKIFGRILFSFWLKTLTIISLCALISGFAEYYLLQNLPVNWFSFAAVVGVCGIIFVTGLLVTSYFSTEEKLWLKSFFKKSFA